MLQYGRQQIFIDEKEVNYNNLLDVLRRTKPEHDLNASDCQILLDYEAGDVPHVRDKTFRKDIDFFIPDALANYITSFKLGYNWAEPITFKSDDDADNSEELTEAIQLLNKGYRLQGMTKRKQQELARFVEICGIGYTYVDINTEYEDGDSFFTVDVFDPRTTFVIRSRAYTDKRVIMGVSYRKDKNGEYLFTCFTKDWRYEVKRYDDIYDWQKNPLGKVPIIEWVRSYDRQGCFERQIPMLDGLTQAQSDYQNAISQNTDCIWVTTDVDLKDENGENITPKSSEWVHIYSTQDGKTPKIEPLTTNNGYDGILSNIAATRAQILHETHVPQRNDNSGGSTGVAMDDAAGWTDAEAEANREHMLFDSFKMAELAVVLAVIKVSPFVPVDSPLLKLRCSDLQPNFKLSHKHDLSVKTNATVALINAGFDLDDIVSSISMWDDAAEVVARSGKGVKKYQEAHVFKDSSSNTSNETGLQDESDQITNSPLIDGMNKEEPVDIDGSAD